MYNQRHFKALFKKHGYAVCSYKLADFVFIILAFATIKAMLVVDLETNIWALLSAGSATYLILYFLFGLSQNMKEILKLPYKKQSLYLVWYNKIFQVYS